MSARCKAIYGLHKLDMRNKANANIVRNAEMERIMHLYFAKPGSGKFCEREIRELYNRAFPREERAPFGLLKHWAKKKRADFYAVYERDRFVGMVHILRDAHVAYVFYLAICEDMRGTGCGSAILRFVKQKYRLQKIVLAIEPVDAPCDNLKERVRRKAFYRKNGFKETDFRAAEFGFVYEMLEYCANGEKLCAK